MTRRKVAPSESGTFRLSTISGGILRFSPDRCEARIGERNVALPDEECRLLRALVEERGEVVTRTALMMATWRVAEAERIGVLENMVARSQERLGPEVTIETVTGIGYRLL